MPKELAKTYNPAEHEAGIYDLWQKSGAFRPTAKGKPYSIIMPPPNANGSLHLGHAQYVVEDILVRYHRMRGYSTLWLPGGDHAGIETQVVFERELAKSGQSRFDLGPAEFYAQALAFTGKNLHNMLNQLHRLGFSADWSRFKFTLDDDVVRTVYETFKQMHDDGLVYRGNRIVNWCPHCRSGFSDLEIKYREQVDPLYYIKYGSFVLATVRPETKFGDTAIAVNPKDERYQKYIGQEIEAAGLLGKFKLTVIGDDYVDPNFGTGVVKVTPAHDPNDWEMGLRHNLEVKQAIGTDGLLTELTGRYAGMPVDQARQQVAHDLEERGLIDHIDMNYTHNVAYHDRCGTLIEPLVTEQWWLKVDQLKQPAIQAVRDGQIKIVPKRFVKVYLDWMENLRDWNISRQNWFGIKIPVYYNATNDPSKPPYIIAFSEAEAKAVYGPSGYEAETDTFDTWFSSGQWPYATLMATGDFDRFYPTSVMATARDILRPWISRMIMFSLYRVQEIPFQTVYLWGMVNDEQGKKMSKSRGNGIDPLEMTDKYGTDALRLALVTGVTAGNDGSLSEKKIEGYRNFNNKLWNVARFVLGQLPNDYSPAPPQAKTLADQWILARINQAITKITADIDHYRFSDAGQCLYSLLWDDFADWYLEASKDQPNLDVLTYGLTTILQLGHPFVPFVSEVIWQHLAWHKQNLIVSVWPKALPVRKTAVADFAAIQELVGEIRNLRVELGQDQLTLLHDSDLIHANSQLIGRLAKVEVKPTKQGRGLAVGTVDLPAWLDVGPETIANYASKLRQRQGEATAYEQRLTQQLANQQFVKSAPEPVVADVRRRQAEAANLIVKLGEQLAALHQD